MKLQAIIAAATILATTVSAATEGAEWTYRENDEHALSPAEWGHGFPACAGQSQSPIDITIDTACRAAGTATPLSFSGDCDSFDLVPHEDAFKWEVTNSTCKLHRGDDTFSLVQFHPHILSEHTLNGKAKDAEFHFVHQLDGGSELLVVGLFLNQAVSANDAWATEVFDSLSFVNETVTIDASYADVLTEKFTEGKVFNYPGSLTNPPCTEGVDWWVVQTPLPVLKESLDNLLTLSAELEATDEGKAARPTQPLNGRTITTY